MVYSENAMCAILLCSYLGIDKSDLRKPFSLGEWNAFLDKISEKKDEPYKIFEKDESSLEEMGFSSEQAERIIGLISRGARIAFELDSLEKKGIYIITVFDKDYPVLLKRKLKKKTPPVLFYAGNLELAKKIGIAVAGARDVDEEGIDFARKLVKKAAEEKLIIYSGGAKGVDTVSEKTALDSGSAVVSYVADSLVSRIKKKDVIKYIMEGKLLLFSDVKPDAGFSAARAMNRNKYIYASAYGAFVVQSDYNTGGTWNGALESIRSEYTKTFIWKNSKYDGNLKLIENGGIPYELTEEKIYTVITAPKQSFQQLNLFNIEKRDENTVTNEQKSDIYNMIKMFIADYLGNGRSLEEAAGNFNIISDQMHIWLEHLCKDKLAVFDKGVYRKL